MDVLLNVSKLNKPSIFLCRDFKNQYLRQSSARIGGKYKKAVYTMYSNESFTERVENKQRKNELGILGPVIRAQIRDVIKVRAYLIKFTEKFRNTEIVKYILKLASTFQSKNNFWHWTAAH